LKGECGIHINECREVEIGELFSNNQVQFTNKFENLFCGILIGSGSKMNSETYHAIGERGSKLSGGEKQRLSISRVAYRNPEIILLDEATSALDSKNEQEVQSALKNLLADKTSIIIAHRLSTIKEVDCILVMQEGSIVEVGSHNELIAQNGTYAEMVSLQNLK
jgi:ABC-type multidrug transport system fused ATPase/permease subunit